MRACFLMLAMLGAAAPRVVAEDQGIETRGTYKAPKGYEAFVADLQALMKQHPDAGKRYGIVDMGADQPVAKVIIWTCEDFGGALNPPDCGPEVLDQ